MKIWIIRILLKSLLKRLHAWCLTTRNTYDEKFVMLCISNLNHVLTIIAKDK